MRHGKKINHLGRTSAHRKAMLSNMASSLILHKRITTTVAKAKALRKYVEPLLTKSKNDTTHSRRTVFSYLENKESLKELFGVVAGKIANRPGGYTRIFKMGNRLGDNADVCIIELVDFNETMLNSTEAASAAKPKTRRRAAGKKKAEGAENAPAADSTEETKAADSTENAE
jgi:large subunit ribosomal protein L17